MGVRRPLRGLVFRKHSLDKGCLQCAGRNHIHTDPEGGEVDRHHPGARYAENVLRTLRFQTYDQQSCAGAGTGRSVSRNGYFGLSIQKLNRQAGTGIISPDGRGRTVREPGIAAPVPPREYQSLDTHYCPAGAMWLLGPV